MPYFDTRDGTSLFYVDWGAGRPVVFVHGLALGSEMWEYQIPFLTENGLRCIAYDHRGCGRSDVPGTGYDFDTLADDLATLLERLELDDVSLVGFSLGAGVIARYLTRFGDARVSRVALVAATTPYLLKSDANPQGVDRSVIYDAFIAGMRTDRQATFAQIAVRFFGADPPGGPVSPEILRWAVDLCNQSSAKATLDLYRLSSESDLRADMASFTVPTLVIHGDSDAFSPMEATAERTVRAIPGSRLEIYDRASHGLFFTHKDRLNGDLLAFVHG